MSTMPAESAREKLVTVVRYLAIVALFVINIVLVGLSLHKHELFPFASDAGAEIGGGAPVTAAGR